MLSPSLTLQCRRNLKLLLMSWIFFGLVLFLPYGVQGTLTPSGTVAVDCGGQQTFTCNVTGITTNSIAGWIIMELVNITAAGSNGFVTASRNPRISTSTGAIVPISTITIADFTMSDNGGTIQCINAEDDSDQGTATISVEPLPPPSNTTATTVGHDCSVITLQWDKPDTPSDITSEVSCASSSTSCDVSCTSSPCNINNPTLNTEYTFTVTLDSGMCGKSMNTTTTATTMDVPSQLMNVDAQLIEDTSVVVTWDQPSNNPPVTFVTVTCMPSLPNCGTYPPSGPCTISGLASNTTYTITVTPNNNCGDGIASYVNVTTNFTGSGTTETPSFGLPIVVLVVPIVAAIILVVLIVIIVIVVVICCMKKKHGVKACPCIKKKEKENDRDGDVIYEDPERNNDSIKMQSSPAYQTVSSVSGTKDDYYYSEMTDGVKMEPSPAYQTVS